MCCHFRRWWTILLVLAVSVATAGCESTSFSDFSLSKLNPFQKEEQPLPGKRIAVLKPEGDLSIDSAAAQLPIELPAASANPDWSQPGGSADNAPGHLALSGGLRTVWRVSAGSGSSSEGRLTASPIIYQGRVYTLDTEGVLSAFSASGGGKVWSVRLTPENEEEEEGFGGGIAADNSRLFVSTGYGTVSAIDPRSGKAIWTRKLGVPIRSSPTAAQNKVFIVTTEGELHCLSADDGIEIWKHRGLPQSATLLSNVSPAVSGEVVAVPFPSGDVVAYKISDGTPIWTESLSRARTRSSLTALAAPARPAIDHGIVYAVGNGGRMIATSQTTGERLWSRNIRSTETPWVAGNMVYVIDKSGNLVALTRNTGYVRWKTKLPGSSHWSGPVLAGGRLWLVSNAGVVTGVDAASGRIGNKRDLKETVAIAPVVASGKMYIYTDKAKLIALN